MLMMKKLLISLIITVWTVSVLAGCADPASSSASPLPSASPSATSEPIPTTPPDTVGVPESDGDSDQVTADGWTYYLDENDAAALNYGEDPPLHRKSADGSSDEDLGLRGFHFDIIGEYIYVDSSYADLDENGNQVWYTTRMNKDGSDQRRLEYGGMSARLVPEGEEKFYFTAAGESAVFVSDYACENVTALAAALPDESELADKLGPGRDRQLDISEIAEGTISLEVTFLTTEGIQMYKGSYKMAADGTGIEKIKGTYYDYQSLESELD